MAADPLVILATLRFQLPRLVDATEARKRAEGAFMLLPARAERF